MVTFAKAEDGVFTVKRHAANAMEEMPTVKGVAAVDDAVAKVKVVGEEEFGFGYVPVGSSMVASIWKLLPPVEFTWKPNCMTLVTCQFANFHGDEPDEVRVR